MGSCEANRVAPGYGCEMKGWENNDGSNEEKPMEKKEGDEGSPFGSHKNTTSRKR